MLPTQTLRGIVIVGVAIGVAIVHGIILAAALRGWRQVFVIAIIVTEFIQRNLMIRAFLVVATAVITAAVKHDKVIGSSLSFFLCWLVGWLNVMESGCGENGTVPLTRGCGLVDL